MQRTVYDRNGQVVRLIRPNEYDPETDTNYCEADLDEDDMERFLRSANDACPFYRPGDEYRTARRQ